MKTIDQAPVMESRIQELSAEFDANLLPVAPYLYNLADQVISTSSDSKWNVLIGDDTSGRLPVHFLSHVILQESAALPTYYIQAGRRARTTVNAQVYRDYMGRIRDKIGAPLRPLVVSDVAASGDTLAFLTDTLDEYAEKVDVAVVASRYELQNKMGDSFAGALGRRAVLDVNRAFESVDVPENAIPAYIKTIQAVVPGRIRKLVEPFMPSITVDPTTYPLTNVETDLRPDAPTAKRATDQTYRRLASHCYGRMRDMAEDYSASR